MNQPSYTTETLNQKRYYGCERKDIALRTHMEKRSNEEWNKLFARAPYSRITDSVRKFLRTWKHYDTAYMLDDAIDDAIETLMHSSPNPQWTEFDLICKITTIATNKLRTNYIREQRRTQFTPEIVRQLIFHGDYYIKDIEIHQTLNHYFDELAKISELQATFLNLSKLWDIPDAEIAKQFCTTPAAVRRGIERAMKNLKLIADIEQKKGLPSKYT